MVRLLDGPVAAPAAPVAPAAPAKPAAAPPLRRPLAAMTSELWSPSFLSYIHRKSVGCYYLTLELNTPYHLKVILSISFYFIPYLKSGALTSQSLFIYMPLDRLILILAGSNLSYIENGEDTTPTTKDDFAM